MTAATRAGTAAPPRPIFVGGQWQDSPDRLDVENPADASNPAGATFLATEAQYEAAVDAAVEAFRVTRTQPAYERSAILRGTSDGVTRRREELARLITLEAAKPIKDALVEVDRTALAFRIGAEEAERITGELIPLDLIPSSRDRFGITRRFPIGPIAAISPFNLPLGLAVHKLAPAMATGNPVVLKPPSKTPLSLLAVAEIIEEAGAHPGSVSVIPMSRALGDRMVSDPRFKLLTFTGSPEIGWSMKGRAGKKKVVLELGGNAAAIVDATADAAWASARIAVGAFKYAGQLCVSTQRLFVHDAVWDAFLPSFLERTAALKLGDPLDPATDIGPMVSRAAAVRTERAIAEAVAMGGRVLVGGTANGSFFAPTVLVDTPPDAGICSNEAFAPVVVLRRFTDFDAAVAAVNESAYGLQTGIFTNDLGNAWRAFGDLEVGGVIVNDIPSYRIDHMPFGGVKDSGFGREGLRWAIEDMTELRLMVLAQPG
jgi:glyceraldehyde-3-phosphate dehydrogenase (NADP+)